MLIIIIIIKMHIKINLNILVFALATFELCRSETHNLRKQFPQQFTSTTASVQSSDDAAFIGFIAGPIAFILSFVVIWYNQKRSAVNKSRLLKIQNLLSSKQKPSPLIEQNMKQQLQAQLALLHVSGDVFVQIPAVDSASNLSIPKALKLDRQVQVRQYRKLTKRDQLPELGWYSYHQQDGGGTQNDQACWFLKPQIFVAKEAFILDYKLNQNEMKSLLTNSKVTPNQDIARCIAQNTNRPEIQWIIEGDYIYFPAVSGQKLSHGTLRIRYNFSKQETLSIIAASDQNKCLYPFRIDHYQNNGKEDSLCCQGKSYCCACNSLGELLKPISQVDLVMQGYKSKEQMISTMIITNKSLTNVLRLVAYFVMVLGIYAFFSPIVDILGYIPLVGGFIKSTVSGFVFLGALIVCIPLFLLTFSLAWLVYHPKTGLLFVVLALIIIGIIIILDETLEKPT